jgi:hypothetical protein
MNEDYEKLCKKHGLAEKAKLDFMSFFEKEIIKVFNRKSVELSGKESVKESVIKKIISKPKTSSDGICVGKKADGKPCGFKAKENGYCGRHDPDKSTGVKSSPGSKPRVKKETQRECHAVIPKTGKKCISAASVKPDGSDFYYCKRHSEKWIDFEQEPEQGLNASEEEPEAEEEPQAEEPEAEEEEPEAEEEE